MKLITGDTGEAHVQAADDRALRATIFGTGAYVLDAGQKFAYTIETANEITLADGELMFQGTHARIPYGDTESVTIENGTTGYNRIDLIVARYEKASGIESMTVKVIKGEPVAGTATQPEYTEGNILEGATVAEMPLYAVTISGVNIASVTPLFTVFTRQLSKLALVSELNTTNQAVSKAQSTADTANAKADSLANALGQTNSILATTQNTANSAQNSANAAYNYAANNDARIGGARSNDDIIRNALLDCHDAYGYILEAFVAINSGGTVSANLLNAISAKASSVQTLAYKITNY